MKKFWLPVSFVIVIAAAIGAAFRFGTKSPIYAAGKIRLADNLTNDAKGIHTLFITFFAADGSPMPFGAMRESIDYDAKGEFFTFMATPERMRIMMMPGQPTPQAFRIKARLDVDGQAGPDSSGDLTGEVDSVPSGAENVMITIDHKVP